MEVEVVLLPRDLKPGQLAGRACAVFDVLRATTTMAAALAAGVKEIRLFAHLDSACRAAEAFSGPKLLCGESRCVMPAGFDLGNSPGQFCEEHRDATMFMCTTNGTRALLAAMEADFVFTAALVNARNVAHALRRTGLDVTLLCAGTDGEFSAEDMIGAAAVLEELRALTAVKITNRHASDALILLNGIRHALPQTLRKTPGGQNIIAAGLEGDIDFAARLNSIDAVGVVSGEPPVVRLQSQE